MPEISLPTATKQNQILETIKDTGVNFYENPLSADFQSNMTDNFNTILEVNGPGELLELVVGSADPTSLMQLKITVDGEELINLSLKASTSGNTVYPIFSIFLKDFLIFNLPYNSSNTAPSNNYFYSVLNNEYFRSFLGEQGSISHSSRAFYLVKNPIVFNESLKVEGTRYSEKGYRGNNFCSNHILYRLT